MDGDGDDKFTPSPHPDEIKHFLRGLGLVPLNDYYVQVKHLLKRQRHSAKTLDEHIQRKLMENGIHKDDLSKNMPLLCPRKRTSFSPVITRKRGKAIKKRTPSATQVIAPTIAVTSTVDSIKLTSQELADAIDDDQPLDLRLQSKSASQSSM